MPAPTDKTERRTPTHLTSAEQKLWQDMERQRLAWDTHDPDSRVYNALLNLSSTRKQLTHERDRQRLIAQQVAEVNRERDRAIADYTKLRTELLGPTPFSYDDWIRHLNNIKPLDMNIEHLAKILLHGGPLSHSEAQKLELVEKQPGIPYEEVEHGYIRDVSIASGHDRYRFIVKPYEPVKVQLTGRDSFEVTIELHDEDDLEAVGQQFLRAAAAKRQYEG
jgi:hypothetical protein